MGYLTLKRYFDFSLSLIGLLIFSPLFCIVSGLLFLEGKPVFYQKRSLGKDKKEFNAIKFRSMIAGFSKVTKFGKILRQTAMDELPQLINIVKGEMSFVGPRNYGIEMYEKANADFFLRLKVTPGLTGLAQILAPKHADNEDVLMWDLKYIQNRSFLLDLKIIFISSWISLTRSWEKKDRKF